MVHLWLTDVASEPVLQTVKTFNPSPDAPSLLTCSTSQSPPHFAIALFLPTSSSAISFPSLMRSWAIVVVSLPAAIPSVKVLVNLFVAAPRFTAVGRDLYRYSKMDTMCRRNADVDSKKSGEGVFSRARMRCCETDRDAKEAIAGAPRI